MKYWDFEIQNGGKVRSPSQRIQEGLPLTIVCQVSLPGPSWAGAGGGGAYAGHLGK